MLRKILFVCIAAFVVGSDASNYKERLIGAINAVAGEFPYQVSLRYGGQHFCGGALISRKHVLTAAHCVFPMKGKQWLVNAVVGTNSLNYDGDTYGVAAMSHHPNYDSKKNTDWMYDIGVITLSKEVTLNDKVQLVKLPTKDVTTGDVATVSGWGTMDNPRTPLSTALQKLDLTVISHQACQKSMPKLVLVDPSYICTYEKKGIGACSGDSGGPLVIDGVIIGVVSGGIPCAIGYPDIFTNVYKYLDYVEPIVNKI